eukprot:403364559
MEQPFSSRQINQHSKSLFGIQQSMKHLKLNKTLLTLLICLVTINLQLQHTLGQDISSLLYNNNCFACIINNNSFCVSNEVCTSGFKITCPGNLYYNMNTGCPVMQYCNGTAGSKGVLFLQNDPDYNATQSKNQTNTTSKPMDQTFLNTTNDGNFTINLPINTTCYLAIINSEHKNLSFIINGTNVSSQILTFNLPMNSMSNETNKKNFTMTPIESVKVITLGTTVNGLKDPRATFVWKNPPTTPPPVIPTTKPPPTKSLSYFNLMSSISIFGVLQYFMVQYFI